jgi:ribosomal protein L11 methyltransferase
VHTRDPAAGDRAAAEAYEAGAVGLEEVDMEDGIALLLYAPVAAADRVRHAVASRLGDATRVGKVEAVPDLDWSERWKAGLTAVVISPRLLIRPSFVSTTLAAGQQEVLIDPGQAFGSGGHASTRLALEWIDALAPELKAGARVLDVGCGSGVLALAALRLADVSAVALDRDPLAAQATRANARANGFAAGIHVVTGSLAALRPAGFDLVVANLLRSELLPLVSALAAQTRPGGQAVFSGLLAGERDRAETALAGVGFGTPRVRQAEDADGECWVSLLMRRRDARASRPAAARESW